MAKASKLPSPCIDVCKFRREGHCIGCSMTKEQKKLFKSLKKRPMQEAFITMLVHQQSALGRYSHWTEAYLRKLRKKGKSAPPPLDRLEQSGPARPVAESPTIPVANGKEPY